MVNPFAGSCGHIFCRECISKAAQATMNTVAENRETYGDDNENMDYMWDEIQDAQDMKNHLEALYGRNVADDNFTPIAVPTCPSCRAPAAFFKLYT